MSPLIPIVSLKIAFIHGDKQKRISILKDISKYDVVLTSYKTLGMVLEYYESITFDNLIIDEGQNIKNPKSQVAKNVKSLYINIEYQIDVWAIDRQTAEEVIRELMFWFYENQELSVTFYGQPLTFTFTVGNNIQDNTDLVNYESNGKIYRYTTNILLSTAIFRTENYFTVQKPKVDIEYLISKEEDKKVKEVKE